MTNFGKYVKAMIEAYATQPGKPYNLSDDAALRIEKKLLELAKEELNHFNS